MLKSRWVIFSVLLHRPVCVSELRMCSLTGRKWGSCWTPPAGTRSRARVSLSPVQLLVFTFMKTLNTKKLLLLLIHWVSFVLVLCLQSTEEEPENGDYSYSRCAAVVTANGSHIITAFFYFTYTPIISREGLVPKAEVELKPPPVLELEASLSFLSTF